MLGTNHSSLSPSGSQEGSFILENSHSATDFSPIKNMKSPHRSHRGDVGRSLDVKSLNKLGDMTGTVNGRYGMNVSDFVRNTMTSNGCNLNGFGI